MAERYTRIYSSPVNLYTPGAPIVMAAGALLKDNQTGKVLAQIKFKSISGKQIKAVKISVSAFDVSGKELEGIAEYQYLDLIAARAAEFGQKQAVTLPDEVTRSFVAKCTDVIFTDGTVWTAAPDAVWTSLPTQKSVTAQLGNLAAQYQRDTSPKSIFIPIEHKDLWLCSCGAINHCEETKCHKCCYGKEVLFAALDVDALRQRDTEYNAAETEKEAKKEAEKEAEKAEHRYRITKFSVAIAMIVAVIASLCLLMVKVIVPYNKYNVALKLIDSGDYEKSYELLYSIKGYKDSTDYLSRFIVCYDKVITEYADGDTSVSEYIYDDNGNMIKELSTYADGDTAVAEYIYDDNGNMIKKLRTYADGDTVVPEFTYDSEYTYDSDGNMIKELSTYADGDTEVKEYTYDSKGNAIKEVQTRTEGKYIYEYTYDAYGNKTKSVDHAGNTRTYEYTYDNKGRIIEDISTSPDGYSYIYEYTYDSKGNKIKSVTRDSDGGVSTTTYTYDKYGNIIRVKSSRGSETKKNYYGINVFYTP